MNRRDFGGIEVWPSGGHPPCCRETAGGKREFGEKAATPASPWCLALSSQPEGFRLTRALSHTSVLTPLSPGFLCSAFTTDGKGKGSVRVPSSSSTATASLAGKFPLKRQLPALADRCCFLKVVGERSIFSSSLFTRSPPPLREQMNYRP